MRVLLLLALVGLALGQVQLGSFEGTYTSSLFGQNTWVCQDDDFVQGSYDEVGIFHCLVNEDGTCVGEFFDAGSGPCVYGSVEISVTGEGFSGFFTCNELEGEFAWAESKLSAFRPTDSQCRLLLNNDTFDDDDEDDLDIQGRWSLEGVSAEHEDICFFDGFTAESSYEYTDEGVIVEGFSAGVYGYGGKVMVGTWYEDFSAGPIIYMLRNNFEVDIFWWTGLEGRDGLSVVNPLDFNDPSRHGVDQLKDRAVTTENQCRRFEILRPFVLQNLDAADDNDDYFYFVGDYFNPIYGFPYYLDSESSSDAAALAVSGVAALAALAALL